MGHPERLRLAVSATTRALPYADELEEAAGARIALTREPGGPAITAASTDAAAIRGPPSTPTPTVYLCGSARFTEAASQLLVAHGRAGRRRSGSSGSGPSGAA